MPKSKNVSMLLFSTIGNFDKFIFEKSIALPAAAPALTRGCPAN